MELLLKHASKKINKFSHVANLLPITKDITFITGKNNKNVNDVIKQIQNFEFVNSVEFIKLYEIDEKNISYTINLKFKNTKNILIEEINKYMDLIIKLIIENGYTVRS
jgi:cytidylate kinase